MLENTCWRRTKSANILYTTRLHNIIGMCIGVTAGWNQLVETETGSWNTMQNIREMLKNGKKGIL